MTAFELPEEYRDWVLTPAKDGYRPPGECLEVYVWHNTPGKSQVLTRTAYFVPPKPKPTLPEVGLGAVVKYRCKAGSMRRAIRSTNQLLPSWRVFEKGIPVRDNCLLEPFEFTDAALLRDVDDDGFTVELEGL